MKLLTLTSLACLLSSIFATTTTSSSNTNSSIEQCCFYSGDGGGLGWGTGVFTVPGNSNSNPPTPNYAVQVPIAIGSSGDVPGIDPWVAVLIAPQSTPQNSIFGWWTTQNKTGQTLYIWSNVNNKPQCISTSVLLPDYFVPGFSLCAGYGTSIFPYYNRTYTISSLGVNVFNQLGSDNTVQASIRLSNDDSCTPIAMETLNTPFGTGSLNVNFEGGTSESPAWTLPTFCKGK